MAAAYAPLYTILLRRLPPIMPLTHAAYSVLSPPLLPSVGSLSVLCFFLMAHHHLMKRHASAGGAAAPLLAQFRLPRNACLAVPFHVLRANARSDGSTTRLWKVERNHGHRFTTMPGEKPSGRPATVDGLLAWPRAGFRSAIFSVCARISGLFATNLYAVRNGGSVSPSSASEDGRLWSGGERWANLRNNKHFASNVA